MSETKNVNDTTTQTSEDLAKSEKIDEKLTQTDKVDENAMKSNKIAESTIAKDENETQNDEIQTIVNNGDENDDNDDDDNKQMDENILLCDEQLDENPTSDDETKQADEEFSISEIIEREQLKIEESMNPQMRNIPSSSRKRKIVTTPTVSLLSFVNILHDIYKDMTLDRSTKQMHFKRNIKAYIDENIDIELKRIKSDVSSSTNSDLLSVSVDFKQKAYNCILNKIINYLETNGMQCLFPKETLKFFLATYSKFITPNDFVNTNSVVKTERRSKNNTPLTNGSILQEYVKGFDVFISNMPRSDHNDIRALKMIVENEISIPHSIYEVITEIKFTTPNYQVDQKPEMRANYSQITISNAKHIFLLITGDILMYFDGNQFVTPQTNIEREFALNVRKSTMLRSGTKDYVLLEVVFATKSRIIDILQCSFDNNMDLPEKYTDRLALIQNIFPNATVTTITPQSATNDASYIQKPNEGFEPAYIYHKSHLIAAAVGIHEKTVALAFLENDDTLVVKSKVSISGAVTCCLSSLPMSKTNEPKILLNDVEYRVAGDLNGIQLFRHALTVEFRDGNRLGYLSTSMLSKAGEYKPIVVRREMSVLMKDIESRLDNEEFIVILLKNLTNSVVSISDEQRKMVKQWLDPSTSVSFDEYNNL